MAQKTDVTVYIGRFSPFHNGHAHVLKQALETSKLVIVLVGSTGRARSIKDPFTFDERQSMIERWHLSVDGDHGALRILPIKDYPYNDALWIRSVQRTVKQAIQEYCLQHGDILTDICITGSDRDRSTWYLSAFPQWKQALLPPYVQEDCDISATKVRHWLFAKDNSLPYASKMSKLVPASTLRFLQTFSETESCKQLRAEFNFIEKYKQSWEAAPYPVTFTTVDAVVVQSGHVLAVRRGAQPGKGLWALPGGFLNQNERLLDGAIRELVEETSISLAEGKNSAKITREILRGSMREKEIFDKPDRSARGRTITTAFLFRLDDTKPLPKVKGMDDAADAFWLPIDEALERTEMWFEDHGDIIETMIGGKDY